ncbi:MAG: Gfo/Idh/MocA family oxidoreductase [Butyrivibrio sp.]|uniref:Gfo/Idh/MocA family protein n=1 Tax=Butyrivibrio sp. TaxID=28121 RepID=UPI0025DD23D0|nr:Gfo/Idh/MocA family oxidoreductase [Butyrivibrio sp.]MCR5770012.1 Gfo/Idh/MocA family oxidoreductase [Butyrivibrio sp.]
MAKEFGWCFIGCGKLANIVAEQITKSGRHKIVSAYTRRYEACKDFADRFSATPYETAEEAIRAEGVDGVYIVTPHSSHYEYAKLALNNGKPVLCEKAFTVNLEQARGVIELANSKKLYIAEAMWTWFSPIARKVKEWLDNDEFGNVESCIADMSTDSQHYAPRVTRPDAAGGAILDVGVYAVYYLYKLFGKPVSIECKGTVRDGIDWDEEIWFIYKDGRKFKAISSIVVEGITPNMELHGDKASIKVNELHYTNHAEFTDSTGMKKEITADGSYLNEFDIVADEIRQGLTESKYVTHKNTLDIMEILDECRKQIGLKYDFE